MWNAFSETKLLDTITEILGFLKLNALIDYWPMLKLQQNMVNLVIGSENVINLTRQNIL